MTEEISDILNIDKVDYRIKAQWKSNGIYGPAGRSWISGWSTKIKMSVSNNKYSKEISLEGNIPVEKNDKLRVYFKNEEKKEISKIEKLSKEGEILLTAIISIIEE